MEKLKSNLIELAFIFLLVRMLTFGAGFGEAIAFFSLVIAIGYKLFLNKEKMDKTEDFDNRLTSLSNQVQSLSMDKAFRKLTVNGEAGNKASAQQPLQRIF